MPYAWKPYVPVAKRREQALRKMNKLKKKGMTIQPVQVKERKIAQTFWGKAWCNHIESFSDYANRLPRGRTYVRNSSVCHLAINNGVISSIVSGSQLYNIKISIKPLPKTQWQTIKSKCAGRIGSLLELLSGRLSDAVMNIVCHPRQGLFPLAEDMVLSCDCPDWAIMCKHIAAALYGVASRLDHYPEQLFRLRDVNHEDLIDVASVVNQAVEGGKAKRPRMTDSVLSQVFDIDLSDSDSVDRNNNAGSETNNKVETTTPVISPSVRIQSQQKATRKQSGLPKYLSGYAIRKKRLLLGFTQSEFGILVGVSASTISKWEQKGRKKLILRPSVLNDLQVIWNNLQ